jgi:hypothetical protein
VARTQNKGAAIDVQQCAPAGAAASRRLTIRQASKKMNQPAIPIILLALAPSVAFAHGQEVVFMPAGQFVALVVVGILLWRLPFRGVAIRVMAVLCVLGVTLPLWYVSVSWFPVFLRNASGFFLIGLVPSVVVALVIFFVQRCLIKRGKGA